VHKHVSLQGIFSLDGRDETEKNNCIFPGLSVRVFYVVCVSNDGHLEGFDLCVVREEGFAGVSEVGFSSLQEPFT